MTISVIRHSSNRNPPLDHSPDFVSYWYPHAIRCLKPLFDEFDKPFISVMLIDCIGSITRIYDVMSYILIDFVVYILLL